MTRIIFLKNLIRYILTGVLALIALVLGAKAVTGANCKSCAGKGICSGEDDCSKFLK